MSNEEKGLSIMSTNEELAKIESYSIQGNSPSEFMHGIGHPLRWWGNNQYGDCVTAEEAFAKSCTDLEIDEELTTELVVNWALSHGFLNGAWCVNVMKTMQHDGFSIGNNNYNDGNFMKVNFTNIDELENAIYSGPLKFCVNAEQLHDRVPNPPNQRDAYIFTGLEKQTHTDHDICIFGYGKIGWLFSQIALPGTPFPSNLPQWKDKLGFAMFTWDSVGIIDYQSLVNISSAAFLRSPTTVIVKKENLPNIASIQPHVGKAGDKVIIKGTGLDDCDITFNGVKAKIYSKAPDEVKVEIPKVTIVKNEGVLVLATPPKKASSAPYNFSYQIDNGN